MSVAIKDFKDNVGKSVTIQGWMFNKRSSGKVAFLELRDGSGETQGVVVQVSSEAFKIAQELNLEASVEVTGTVSRHPKFKDKFELQVFAIKVFQNPTEEYPIGKKEHGPEFLLDNRHLWLRSRRQAAIQKIRHTAMYSIMDFFDKRGFTRIDAPIFTPNACEGTTTLFSVDYFDEGKAYLSQSGQLYQEAAIFGLGKVYDFGPVFRAEKSKTRRHLTEFWMMDAEMAFHDQKMNMDVQEAMFVYIVEKVLEKNMPELVVLERNVEELQRVKGPFHHIKHKDAWKKLADAGFAPRENDDFGADEEIALANMFDRPVFVENYPAGVKAFYMKRDPSDDSRVLCADMLLPGYGEVIGGSQREDDYNILLGCIKDHGLKESDFSWYLDLRKYGSVPHSGFGIGLERMVTWLCALPHVRESIPFPRLINRLRP
ncbi:asparagine--tRNA ligase [Candidatus Peregrinibacteria bacterium]|nr:asparagine--tRNA ligase [Candidatus Peregrinibacteria bacterium]